MPKVSWRGRSPAGLPVILQISENCVRYHQGLAAIADATLAVARAASVPVAVHLDHATDDELVRAAADLGLGSVMYDTSAMPYKASVSATKALAGWCHDRGMAVEAELGEIGGKDGVHSPVARTRHGRGGGIRAGHGRRRPGGGGRELACDADQGRGP